MTVVADAGPLIALAKIHGLDALFALFPEVLIPPAVYEEAIKVGCDRGSADARLLLDRFRAGQLRTTGQPRGVLPLVARLGRGEEEAILLATQERARWALLDDRSAREAAERCFQAARGATRVKGTLGVIATAFQAGHLERDEAIALVTTISNHPDIWIHTRLCQQVIAALRAVGPAGAVAGTGIE